jgi:hypothetical protein
MKKTPIIIILVLIVLLLLQGWYYKTSMSIETVVTKVETRIDTVTINSVEYVPQVETRILPPELIYVDVIDTVLINTKVDTAAILIDYYSKYVYQDVLDLDTLGSVTIIDTVSQNKIQSRQFTSDIIIPTKTITNTTYINDKGFYYGVGLGINQQMLHSVSGEVLYKTKRNIIYGVGLGLGRDNQLLSPVVSGKVYWKIGKKGIY